GYAELAIARRLHRGGEGQYLVNGASVRRTDVVELLAELGLGRSIVGQGRVEEILSSRPAELRALVEDAAGLGVFKRRRHRAELKLARVATQVERAHDVEKEVRARIRPLALQATAAERAEKLSAEVAALEARLAALDAARLEEGLAELAERRSAPRPRSRPGRRGRSSRRRPRRRGQRRSRPRAPSGSRGTGSRRSSASSRSGRGCRPRRAPSRSAENGSSSRSSRSRRATSARS